MIPALCDNIETATVYMQEHDNGRKAVAMLAMCDNIETATVYVGT